MRARWCWYAGTLPNSRYDARIRRVSRRNARDLDAITLHVPDPNGHLVRACGVSKSRAAVRASLCLFMKYLQHQLSVAPSPAR